jgi:Protein of unknown function (DUF2933)
MRSLLPLLLLVACPLMMVFMMRGMHGGGHQKAHADHSSSEEQLSAVELRALRAELDARLQELNDRVHAIEATEGRPADAAPATEAAPV